MQFENYEDWKVYPPQARIYFPKHSSKNKTAGFGSALFLLTPKTTSSFDFMKDKNVALRMSLYKYYMIETMYKEKIGRKNIIMNMTRQMESLYNENNIEKETNISFIPRPQKKARLKSGNNIVVDLSMWMELYLKYTVTIQNPKEKCKIFIDLLDKLLKDSNYNDYEKLICIDINSWTNRAADCVMMNRELLNNPLSILIYSMVKYPDLLNGKLKNFRIYLVNRSSKQIFLFNTNDLNKENYNKFKTKIKLFKGISISSSEDLEGNTKISDGEAKAIAINDYKNKVLKSMRSNLLGNNKPTEIREIDEDDELIDDSSDYDDIFDVTKEVEEDSDEPKPSEDNDIFDEMGADLDLDAEALAELDKMIGDVDDVSTEDILNTPIDEVADDLAEQVKNTVFIAGFKPTRTSEQEERNREMMDIQTIALNQENIDNAKTKIIDTTDFSEYINSSNVNILQSKFVNFDKDYVEKKMEGDIDNAVACLSGATDKIFITNKEVIDTSDSLNLKRTLKYSLEDEKGNKMTITFDVPIIIDNCYIYINGSKKLIGHQFILKPLVKTGPDTVQLVTSYNKVFITRDGVVDHVTSSIITYMEKNLEKFKCVRGNSSIKNKKYNTALDFTMYAKRFTRFTIGNEEFITGIEEFYERYNKKYPTKNLKLDKKKIAEKYPISFNKKTGEVRYMKSTESFSDILLSVINEEDKKAISRIKKKPRLVYVRAKLMGQVFPIALLLMYHEGFASIMKRADIAYQFTDKKTYNKMDKMRYDFLELSDGLVVWERRNMLTSLLMNGLKRLDFTPYTIEELESKDTYRSLLVDLYNGDNSISYKIDQFYDFTIDSITKEILEDMKYPTNLPDLLILAVKMLCDSAYALENNMNNMRIRSNEVIPAIIHKEIADAYNLYRKTSYKKKPVNVSIKPNIIIDKLLSADTNLIEEFSTINPVLEIEKARCVTFKGYRGIQLDRAITLPRRGYDPSMLGIMGISTSSDANCGVNRQMTLEPAITSTRGYLEVNGIENVNSLTDANLLSPAELLTPLGVIHDDPDRTAMSYKQTKYMIPVADSSPVLIGNKVEAIMPYLISNEFVVDAKQDGEVVEISGDYCVIRYKDGSFYSIDIASRIKKNASAGFFIDNKLTCNLKVGDKFKKGDILAYSDKAFTPNRDGKGASMNLGVLTKIAIVSNWDIYEDSAPITKKLAERLASDMVWEKAVSLNPGTYIEKMAKIGDKIKTGESLMLFEEVDDADFAAVLKQIRQENQEELIENTKSTITSKYTGEVVDIKIYSTVPVEEMDESLAKIVTDYYKKVEKRNNVLEKYKNPGDCNYYKSGQVISEESKIMKPSKSGKIKGEYAENSVVIVFYVKYRDVAAKGDKICAQFALKGVCSHVIEEGLEPYSEYRPDEEISALIAPLAVSARKVPSVFKMMFGNKLLIELKRHLKEMYLNN